MKPVLTLRTKLLAIAAGLAISGVATAQLIYGNTFPFWTVNGPLTVTGVSTLSGGQVLSGTTTIGSGATLTSPTLTGPTVTGTLSGAAATFSTTLAVTGVSTLTGGILGSATNDAATAGNVGELLTTTVAAGGAVACGATTAGANVTSQSLTAGDWDVSGSCNVLGSTLIGTVLSCGLGTSTNTQLTQAGGGGVGTDPLTRLVAASQTFPNSATSVIVPPTRVTLASTTTIYLVGNHTYSSGSCTQYGTIRARRMR